jgi:hypothetical protein
MTQEKAMTQSDLNRAVARATGESVSFVKYQGFLLDDPTDDADDSDYGDTEPQVIDWDQLDAERSIPILGRPCRELVPA